MSERKDQINVVVAMDFSDAIMERIRDVSPRLNVVQHFPNVPDSAWQEVEVLYTVRQFPDPEQAPMLRWIQLNYAGLEGVINQRIIQSEDVVVTTASGIHTRQMANYCMMMMMAFNYQMPKMYFFQRRHEWPDNRRSIYNPQHLHHQTLGIAGYGSIGRELARIAQALGMTVVASKRDAKQPAEGPNEYTPEGTGDPEGKIPERIYPGEALASMASECDYLVLIMPLTDETHHIVHDPIFDAMKETAILINIARGGVVDEKALVTALSSGKIGGAALDVFEEEPLPSTSPLWEMDNVIISPHISGVSAHYHEDAADLFIANLKRYLEKRPLMNQLNREIGY